MALIRHPRRRPNSLWNFPQDEALKFDMKDYMRAKRSGIPLAKFDIAIKCLGGKNHTIRISFPGELKCMHHQDMEAERTMAKLGGEKSECLKWVELFRQDRLAACRGRYYAMKFLHAVERVATMRREALNQYRDMFEFTLADRMEQDLNDLYNKVKEKIRKTLKPSVRRSMWSYDKPKVEEDTSPLDISLKLVYKDKLNKPKEEPPSET